MNKRHSLMWAIASLAVLGIAATAAGSGTDLDEPFVPHVPVLTFHRVTCPEPDTAIPELWICPDRFRAQLEGLKQAGWTTVTAGELAQRYLEQEDLPARSFAITLDDGMDDGYHEVAPILADLGMQGTFYVVAGKTPSCDKAAMRMTWCEVRGLRDLGHDIGDHSVHHERIAALSDEQVVLEVQEAQETFARELGSRPTTFAYPYGEYDARYISALEASDLVLAFTFHGPGGPPGPWVDDAYIGEDRPYEAERIMVYPTDEPDALVAKLEPLTRWPFHLSATALLHQL